MKFYAKLIIILYIISNIHKLVYLANVFGNCSIRNYNPRIKFDCNECCMVNIKSVNAISDFQTDVNFCYSNYSKKYNSNSIFTSKNYLIRMVCNGDNNFDTSDYINKEELPLKYNQIDLSKIPKTIGREINPNLKYIKKKENVVIKDNNNNNNTSEKNYEEKNKGSKASYNDLLKENFKELFDYHKDNYIIVSNTDKYLDENNLVNTFLRAVRIRPPELDINSSPYNADDDDYTKKVDYIKPIEHLSDCKTSVECSETKFCCEFNLYNSFSYENIYNKCFYNDPDLKIEEGYSYKNFYYNSVVNCFNKGTED